MIESREVSKKLGKFILKNSSFTLPDGYICGLAGPNGAGKSRRFSQLEIIILPTGEKYFSNWRNRIA